MASPRPVRIATRGSRLALWQSERVAARLGVETEMVIVSTVGDRRTDVPIWTIGGTGVFVKEVQQAVLEGRADLAVHSAKDLPSQTAAGLRLAAVPERADPRDARPIPATPSSAAGWTTSRPGGRSGPGPSAAGPSWPRFARISSSPRSAATSRRGWPRRPSSMPWWWRSPPSSGSA